MYQPVKNEVELESELKHRGNYQTPKNNAPESEVHDHSGDAGNQADDHYKQRLSPFRYQFRSYMLPIVRHETDVLYKLQSTLRNPVFDFYFAWTANLASHTFYILMLPPPIWFGASKMARDLVYVLGLGIYLSGFLKDFFCLPRPRSPPLHRITMSSYTTQEYGFPSSHSANATAVSLIVLNKIITNQDSLGVTTYYSLIAGLMLYYFSLIFGRLYTGMHGFLDIFTGSAVGVIVFLFRYYLGEAWDTFMFSHGFLFGTASILGLYLFMIHIYPEPIDDCPCFDDSVAFVGVLIGLDFSHLVGYQTRHFFNLNDFGDYYLLPFINDGGALKLFARFFLGVGLVVAWKSISKPIIFTILPPVYKVIGVYLPRRNYISTAHTSDSTRRIRSASIKNDVDQIGNFNNFIKGVSDHSKLDSYGPSSDIDYYEIMDYNKGNKGKPISLEKLNFKSGVFKDRYDVEIVGRLIVYAGVSTVSVWAFHYAARYLNL
ncbi:LCB3 [Candida margitis]|uniref:LCB3 n=1 Tax=Candida margitis TaxID=1775924 RepID=UPI002225F76B|nr:LCB3 [Candida margitis]KAI5961785.1 LCB3 [Candida margitis]